MRRCFNFFFECFNNRNLKTFVKDILQNHTMATWNQYFPHNPLQDSGLHPFTWDEGFRTVLRVELDTIYAKLYGLMKDEFEYILTMFSVLKKSEKRNFLGLQGRDAGERRII